MSIRKRGEKWVTDLTVRGHRVRRVTESFDDAKQLADQLERSAIQGPGYVTLDEVLRRYVAKLRARSKPRSARQAEIHVGVLLRYLNPTLDARAFHTGDVEHFIQSRQAEGVKATTINGGLRVLRAALRHAVDLRLIPSAPKVALLRELRKLPTRLEVDGVEKLLAAAVYPADLAILLAAHAGLRLAEIIHLVVDDVGLEERVVRVTAKKAWSPKSHAEREVPTTARLAEALEPYVLNRDPTEWIFPSPAGGLPRQDIGIHVREAYQRAGLYSRADRTGLHMLRRTWASRLLANGVDIETLRELGGWADIATVQRYLASTSELKRAAVATLE